MDTSEISKDIEIPQSYSKFIELMGDFQKFNSKNIDFLDSFIRSEASFSSLIQDDFQETGKIVTSQDLSPEKHLESNEGLYTFTKESSFNEENIHAAEKFTLGKEKIRHSSQKYNKKSENLIKLREVKREKPRFIRKNEEMFGKNNKSLQNRSTDIINTDRNGHKNEEISNLQCLISNLAQELKKKDSEMKKMAKTYENKIKTLEILNSQLWKKLSNNKIHPRRTSSYSHSPILNKTSGHSKKNSIFTETTPVEMKNLANKKEIAYPNGSRAEVYPNGFKVIYYQNRDIKQEYPDGKQIYFFAKEQTIKTTFFDGLQEIKFSNGQIEKLYPDGTKEIKYVNGTVKCIFANGEEETVLQDGTIEKKDKNGFKSRISKGKKEVFVNDMSFV